MAHRLLLRRGMRSRIFLSAFLLSTQGAFADPPATGRAAAPPPAEASTADFGEIVNVSITSIRARFLDDRGAPIRGIRPEDLDLRVGGQPVPVAVVDWVTDPVDPDDQATPSPSRPVREASYTRHRVSTFGQLFVFYVQTGPERRVSPRARESALLDARRLLGRLKPEDLAAVVSYDGRLLLQLDFTRDREAAARALERAVRTGELPEARPAAGAVALAPVLATAAAEQQIGPEPALERTARALGRLPGEKVTIYLGLETFPFQEVASEDTSPSSRTRGMTFESTSRKRFLTQTPEMIRAILALQDACASVFVLDDTSSVDAYRGNLQVLARLTGGSYARLTGKAVDSLARTLEGYYVLTLNPEEFPVLQKKERVELRLKRRKAQVLAMPLWALTE